MDMYSRGPYSIRSMHLGRLMNLLECDLSTPRHAQVVFADHLTGCVIRKCGGRLLQKINLVISTTLSIWTVLEGYEHHDVHFYLTLRGRSYVTDAMPHSRACNFNQSCDGSGHLMITHESDTKGKSPLTLIF